MASQDDEGMGRPAAASDPAAPRSGSAEPAKADAARPGEADVPRVNPYTAIDPNPPAGPDAAGASRPNPYAAIDPNPTPAMQAAEAVAADGIGADPHGMAGPAGGKADGIKTGGARSGGAKPSPKDALIEALMELAGERVWEDITLTDIAARANVSLADFRDAFPSKGAVLAGFSRKIDRIVLEGTDDDLAGEPAKDRLFDVLMRRLDALAPYRLGLESVTEWLGRAPLAAAAVNRLEVNSMRFMLEAAGIDSEGAIGALKLQGLVVAWGRVIQVWLRDDDPSLSKTMNVLDKELTRGARIVGRADDINRLVSPLIALTKAMFERRPDYPRETARPAEEPAGF